MGYGTGADEQLSDVSSSAMVSLQPHRAILSLRVEADRFVQSSHFISELMKCVVGGLVVILVCHTSANHPDVKTIFNDASLSQCSRLRHSSRKGPLFEYADQFLRRREYRYRRGD